MVISRGMFRVQMQMLQLNHGSKSSTYQNSKVVRKWNVFDKRKKITFNFRPINKAQQFCLIAEVQKDKLFFGIKVIIVKSLQLSRWIITTCILNYKTIEAIKLDKYSIHTPWTQSSSYNLKIFLHIHIFWIFTLLRLIPMNCYEEIYFNGNNNHFLMQCT